MKKEQRLEWMAPEIEEIQLDDVLDVAEMRLAFATTSCSSTGDCDIVPLDS